MVYDLLSLLQMWALYQSLIPQSTVTCSSPGLNGRLDVKVNVPMNCK